MPKLTKHTLSLLIVLGTIVTTIAQTNTESTSTTSNVFEENYYDALKNKALENYDKALINLEKCIELQPQNDVIYHEIGKNYFYLNQYLAAETYYTKATQASPNNKWYWIDLYEVYYQTKNHDKAINTLQKIIPLDSKYKDNLLSLYMYLQSYDKALKLLDELDETEGKTERRNQFRLTIKQQKNNTETNTKNIENTLNNSPESENDYLAIIAKYTNANQDDKAKEWIEKLQKHIPHSIWPNVFMFKYHITDAKEQEAYKDLQAVLKNKNVDKKIKIKMFNEYLIFTYHNPSLEDQLLTITPYFENDDEFLVYKELGKFYFKKNQWNKALHYLEKNIKTNPNDIETAILITLSYDKNQDFNKLLLKAIENIELFPNQPEFYYFAGKANYNLKNFTKAIDFLETGIDYVVDNPNLENDFLILLKQLATTTGNAKKADEYQLRATKVKNKK